MSGAGEKISGLLWLVGIGSIVVCCAAMIPRVFYRPTPPTPAVVTPVPPTAVSFVPTPTTIPVTAVIQSPVPTVPVITFPQEVTVVDMR